MDTRRLDFDYLRISLYGIDLLSQLTLQYDDYFSMILNASMMIRLSTSTYYIQLSFYRFENFT